MVGKRVDVGVATPGGHGGDASVSLRDGCDYAGALRSVHTADVHTAAGAVHTAAAVHTVAAGAVHTAAGQAPGRPQRGSNF